MTLPTGLHNCYNKKIKFIPLEPYLESFKEYDWENTGLNISGKKYYVNNAFTFSSLTRERINLMGVYLLLFCSW
jgi:hypothetical protein